VINDTTITNLEFNDVIKADGDNVFLFLNPPNHSVTKYSLYGKNGNLYNGFDHVRFAETMKNCNYKRLITYDDSEYIRELFSFANVIAWDLTYGMRYVADTSDRTGKELFISNYLTKLPRQVAKESQFTLFEPKVRNYRTKKTAIV